MLLKAQLLWTGHVIRMEEHGMPCPLLYGKLVSGKRSQGRSRKRFKDSPKENFKWRDVKPGQLEPAAMGTMQLARLVPKSCDKVSRREMPTPHRCSRTTPRSRICNSNKTEFHCPSVLHSVCPNWDCTATVQPGTVEPPSKLGLHSHRPNWDSRATETTLSSSSITEGLPPS